MRRKITKMGQSSLVITLPSKWVKKYNVKKGDEVEIDDDGERKLSILLKTQDENYQIKAIEIDISTISIRVTNWILSCMHKKGFDEIKIHYSKENKSAITTALKQLLTGFVITDEKDNCVTIRSISNDNPQEFFSIFRRVFLVTITMAQNTCAAIKEKNYDKLSELLELENTNNQLTNFCERLINKGFVEKNSTFYYAINWNLEKVCDDYKNICLIFSSRKKVLIRTELISIFQDAIAYLRGYYELIFSFDVKKLNELNNLKDDLLSRIDREHSLKKSEAEELLLHYLHSNVIKVSDFSVSLMGINFSEK
ncbi:MAG: AbrB/MazE/SpoVT family DNA-binding domain-containing protein [archaeon]